MHFVDCAGMPGSGKSTLCDAFFGPHAIAIDNALPPASWQPFIDEITRLFGVIGQHPTLEAAHRMVNRSVRKVATVSRMDGSFPYIQTCLVQRGLGFGWRIADLGVDINKLRGYFDTMPVSAGVVFTHCDPDVVAQRNRHRETIKATQHENRAFMVPLMEPAIELAKEVLNARGVPVAEVSTEQSIDDARRELVNFAIQNLGYAAENGSGGEMATVSTLPPWWR